MIRDPNEVFTCRFTREELEEIYHAVSPGLERCVRDDTPYCASCDRHESVRREIRLILEGRA